VDGNAIPVVYHKQICSGRDMWGRQGAGDVKPAVQGMLGGSGVGGRDQVGGRGRQQQRAQAGVTEKGY